MTTLVRQTAALAGGRLLPAVLFLVVVISPPSSLAQEKGDISDGRIYEETVAFEGAVATELRGAEAGLPEKAAPGAKFVSSKDLAGMHDQPRSGLFLIDMDFVPVNLLSRLAESGYDLRPSGDLLAKDGTPVLAFLRERVFRLETADKGIVGKRLGGLMDTILPDAKAAVPYELRCATWAWLRSSDSGFCRSIHARTWADTWGPDEGGGCGPERPHTRVEYIETRAEIVNGPRDRDSCSNCDQNYSHARESKGCVWPAIGGFSTYHYAHVKDGPIRGTASIIER
jgi:hypothetical protein